MATRTCWRTQPTQPPDMYPLTGRIRQPDRTSADPALSAHAGYWQAGAQPPLGAPQGKSFRLLPVSGNLGVLFV